MLWSGAIDAALSALSRMWRRPPQAPPRSRARLVPPYRRKLLFEMLEPRLLLSADPVASVSAGVLSAQLSEGDDYVVVRQLDAAPGGGVIVDLTVGSWTQTFGSLDEGIVGIDLQGLGGLDTLKFIDLTTGLPGDADWLIDGADAGSVASVDFTGIESLVGADDNQDRFSFVPGGSLSGALDGGFGGFDSLAIEGGDYSSIVLTPTGADSGSVGLDGMTITYAGLEPLNLFVNTAAEIVFNATALADVITLANGTLPSRLSLTSGGTFEGGEFNIPTTSITINAGGGNDLITINATTIGTGASLTVNGDAGTDTVTVAGALSMAGGALRITSESIAVNSGVTVNTGAGLIELIAADDDTASVLVQGDLRTTGNATLSATVTSAVGNTSLVGVIASGTRSATAAVDGGTVHAAQLDISATTTGTISASATVFGFVASNTFTENATARITNSTDILVSGLSVHAASSTAYTALGLFASNEVSGATRAYVQDSIVSAGAGGVVILAEDNSSLTARSPGFDFPITVPDTPVSIDPAIAQNTFDKDIEAYIAGSTVSTTGAGAIDLDALKTATLLSAAHATAVSESVGHLNALSFAGTYSSNEIRGDVNAYIDDSTATTGGTGDITLNASDTSNIDAVSETSAKATGGDFSVNTDSMAIGASIAFNSIGWDPTPAVFLLVDALIGDPALSSAFGLESGADTRAYIQDSEVDAGGALSVTAASSAVIDALVTNATSATADGDMFGASGSSSTGIVASNRVSSSAQAYIAYTDTYVGTATVGAGDGAGLSATDNAAIHATITLAAASEANNSNDFASADSIGVAGAVSLNDVHSGASAYVDGATVTATAGEVSVTALEDATIQARLTSEAKSKGGPGDFGDGTSLAINGLIATNAVRAGANAYVQNSDITASAGGLAVDAQNTALIEAEANNSVSSGGTSIGLTLAFNSIGWRPQNFLFNTIDVLIGSPEISSAFSGAATPSGATASIIDSVVDVSGALAVTATAAATIRSEISNETTAAAAAGMTGSTGTSFGLVVAQNKVNSKALAYIDNGGLPGTSAIAAGDGVMVSASDTALIEASIALESATAAEIADNTFTDANALGISGAVSMNDVRGGATAYILDATVTATGGDVSVSAVADATLDADMASEASTKTSGGLFDGGGSTTINALVATNVVQGGAEAYISGSTVTNSAASPDADDGNVRVNAQNTANIDATSVNATKSGGMGVGVTLAFNSIGWAPQNILFNTIDAIIGDPAISTAFGAENGAGAKAYILGSGVSASGSVVVGATASSAITSGITNTTEASAGGFTGATGTSFGLVVAQNKVSSEAQAYISGGTTGAGTGVSVSASDTASITATMALESAADAEITDNAFSDANALGIAGAVSMNDVRGGASAYITGAMVTATGGNVSVTALEDATLNAMLESEAETSTEAGLFGGGSSTSINALIATNVVQSEALAHVTSSSVDADAGNILVDADNTALIDASTLNAVVAGDTGVGVTLAFNSIGWAPQNVLFNTVDALIGDPAISSAFGGEVPSGARAYAVNSALDASGSVTVSATSAADLGSVVQNQTSVSAGGLSGANGMSFGLVVSQNKVSSEAQAYISGNTTDAGAGVFVSASDTAAVTSTISLDTSAAAETEDNPFGDASAVGVSGAVSMNDVRGGASAYITGATVTATGGNVHVTALEDATLNATLESAAKTSSSGGLFGGGSSTSINALIATNVVQSEALAHITGSTVDADAGDILVDADNTALIDASTLNAVSAGDTGVGVTLAFNSIGWLPQNVLFNTVDALIGDPAISSAFGGEVPSGARAYAVNSALDASGSVTVSATAAADLGSVVKNQADTSAGGFTSANGASFGLVVAQNKVSSEAQAYISGNTTDAGAGVTVSASDTALVTSLISLDTSAAAETEDNPFASASALGVSGAVSMNDVRGGASAYITGATVTATGGNVHVTALEDATLNATLESAAETSTDGGLFGGGSDTAINALIATNVVQSEALAHVTGSTVDADAGNILVDADNTALIDASALNAVISGGTGVGVTLAFNSIGWLPQNVLFNTVDALIGDPAVSSAFNGEVPSGARAYADDSVLDASGTVTVSATAAADLGSVVHNKASVSAGGFLSASGTSFGLVVAQNKVSSEALAYVGSTSNVTGDGGVSVSATDLAMITAEISLESSVASEATAPFVGGASALGVSGAVSMNDVRGGASAYIDGATVTASGGSISVTALEDATLDATLESQAETSTEGGLFGGGSETAINALIATNVVQSDALAHVTGSTVTNTGGGITIDADNTASIDATTLNATASGGTSVGVTLAFNSIGWLPQNILFNTVDALIGDPAISSAFNGLSPSGARAYALDSELDASGLVSVTATAAADLDSHATNDVSSSASGLTDASGVSVGVVISQNKAASAAEAYIGYGDAYAGAAEVDAGGGVLVSASDQASIDATMVLVTEAVAEGDTPFSSSSSIGVSAAISLNDVRGGAHAYIDDATVTATGGNVSVSALEDATLNATINSDTVSSSSSVLSSTSIAVNAVIATNLVQSSAIAEVLDSDVDADAGSILVDADNTSSIDADIHSATKSDATSVGVTLAFNTIGWQSQNFLFNTVDALFGASIGTEVPAETRASTSNSDLTAGLGISITADSTATIDATVHTSAAAIGGTVNSATSVSVGAAITMNKISTVVEASIDGATLVEAGGGDISVQAGDLSAITSKVDAPSIAVAVGGSAALSVSVGLSVARNEIANDLQAFIRNVGDATATDGSIRVGADEDATIDATASASAISVAASLGSSKAFSGGGAIAVNIIGGAANAFIEASTVEATGAALGDGAVVVETDYDSGITAEVATIAFAGAIGLGTTPAVAIGFSLARNLIGWTEFSGADPLEAKAYTLNSQLTAAQTISLSATSTASIDATVEATAAAIAASAGSAVAASAAGLWTDNRIALHVNAYIDGSSAIESDGDISVTAQDASTITADAQAVAVSANLSGGSGASISIGLSLAHNTIDNDIAAYIRNASSVLTGGGDVIVGASDTATITASSVAVAVSAGVSAATGVAVSGGAAESTNVILTTTNAYIEGSALGTALDKVGDVDLDASSTSTIRADIGAVAAAVTFGGTTGVGVAIGIAVARNFIGWSLSSAAFDYETSDEFALGETLLTGDRVKISEGARAGDVFEYLGPTLDAPNLRDQDYSDTSLWKQVNVSAQPAEVQAYIENSSIQAAGALTADAIADQSIAAVVTSAAAALSGGGSTGVAVSGAGVYSENKIKSLVKAYIDGDGATGITAGSVALNADDASRITAVAGAASLAASVGGSSGTAVSIGLSIALNEISNEVESFIRNADQGVTSTAGGASDHITLSATTSSGAPAEFFLTPAVTIAKLQDAAKAAQDDPDTMALDEALDDADDDANILEALRAEFASELGITLPTINTVSTAAKYKISDGLQTLKRGDTVKLADGSVYRYRGADQADETEFTNLAAQLYETDTNWKKLPALRISEVVEDEVWTLVAGDGSTYILKKDEINPARIIVTQANINAVSAAASLAVGSGGATGVGVSGAGAVSQNVFLTQTNAFIDSSIVGSAGNVELTAESSSEIQATVAAMSVGGGGGGTTGVGASIGVSVARNFIGWTPSGTSTPAEVQAYIAASSVTAAGSLTQTATASQSINALVLSASAAVGAGGVAGVGASGSGVFAENKIGADVKAYIDGDGATGISADSISLSATDESTISAVAAAASLAASLGGVAGVSVSIGVSLARNTITSEVESYIKDADAVAATAGGITIAATETATIRAVSAAASLAAGIGGVAGVAVSGAGADALNVILTKTNAYVENSALTATGAVDLDAINTAAIDATIISAAFSVAVGGVAGVGASIGVALARNYIGWDSTLNASTYTTASNPLLLTNGQTVKIASGADAGSIYRYVGSAPLVNPNPLSLEKWLTRLNYADQELWEQVDLVKNAAEVQAYLLNSSVAASGALTLDATSDQTIDARVLAGAVAISGGTVGASLSGAGASAKNKIAADVQAYIEGDGSTGISASSVTLSADDTSVINAFTGAASLGASVGAVGVAVSVGVGLAFNEISNVVSAYIKDADTGVTSTTGDIRVEAIEAATINATAGAASLAASAGAIAGSVSGAGAYASNVILTKTNAYVDNSRLTSARDVVITATNGASIHATVVTASAALSGGLVGAGLSLGASLAKNSIGYDASGAYLPAEVQAYVKNSSINAADDVQLTATSTATIVAEVFSGSVAASAGAVGASMSGAGASAVNLIATNVKAYIDGANPAGAGIGIVADSISISATDDSTIDATVGSASLAAAFGAIGTALSVGVATARNEVRNNVAAYIRNAGGAGDTVTTRLGGDISISALEDADIDALTVAASAAVGGGLAGIALSGAGADAKNVILTTVNAFVDNSVLDSGRDVVLTATDTALIDAEVAALSGALAVGVVSGAVSIGVSTAQNVIGWTAAGASQPAEVQAYVTNSSIDADRDLKLTADENATILAKISADSVAVAAGAVAAGASAAGASTQNRIQSFVKAYIDGDRSSGTTGIHAGNSIALKADDTSTIRAITESASIAGAVGALGGAAISVGLGFARNEIGSQVEAYIAHADGTSASSTDYGVTTTTGDVKLEAINQATIEAKTTAASVAVGAGFAAVGISGAGADAKNVILGKTNAYIDDSLVDSGRDIVLDAHDTATIRAEVVALADAISVGAAAGSIAIGASSATNLIGWTLAGISQPAQVQAYVTGSSLNAARDVLLTAEEDATITAKVSADATALAAGLGGIGIAEAGARTQNRIQTDVKAYISGDRDSGTTGIHAGNSIALMADDVSTITARTESASLAAAFGVIGASVSVGVALAENEIRNVVEAYIANADGTSASGTDYGITTTSGDVRVEAVNSANISARAVAASAAASVAFLGGAAISGAGADARNVILGKTRAHIDNSLVASGDDVIVTADDAATIHAQILALSDAVAGGVVGTSTAIGVSKARNFIGWTLAGAPQPAEVLAYVSNSSVDAADELAISALEQATITAHVKADSVSISVGLAAVGGAGAGASTENKIKTLVKAYIDGDRASGTTGIEARSIALKADDHSTITANTQSASVAESFGLAGASVSLALGLARNEISNEVQTYIRNADGLDSTLSDDGVSTAPDFTSASVSAALKPGDRVLLAADYGVPDFNTGSVGMAADQTPLVAGDKTFSLVHGNVVRLVADYTTTPDPSLTTKLVPIRQGDFVRYNADGLIYRYVGANPAPGVEVDLVTEDYSDTDRWQPVGGQLNAAYAYVGLNGAVNLKTQDYSDTTKWRKVSGDAGDTYQFVGANATRDLTAQDYAADASWQLVTPGDIKLEAIDDATITATASAASSSASGGVLAGGVSEGGAEAKNVILSKTKAFVEASDLASARDVIVSADSTATINAAIAAVSDATSAGLAGVSAAIGSSTAKNFIGYTAGGAEQRVEVQAYVTNASIDAARDIDIVAESSATIHANVEAGAVALMVGVAGGAASGAGATAENRIAVDVKSTIDGTRGGHIDAGGAISLSAHDTSTVTSNTVASSVARMVGLAGGSVSIGVAGATNSIANLVEAYALSATIDGAPGGTTILAQEDATLTSNAEASAVSSSFSFGGSFAGGGAGTSATVSTLTRAYVQDSTLDLTGDLGVTAQNNATVIADVAASALSIGLIASAASGSVVTATLAPVSAAYIANSSVTAEDITVSARAKPKADLMARGMSVSTGASMGASLAEATLSPVVTAYVGGGGAPKTITADSLTVSATGQIPAGAPSALVQATGSAGGLLLGFDATVTRVTNNSMVRGYVLDGTVLDIAGATNVSATNNTRQVADSSSDAFGLLAAGVTAAKATATTLTEAYLGANVQLTGARLNIQASGSDDNLAITKAGAGGLGAGASTRPETRNQSTVTAEIRSGAIVDLSTRGSGEADIGAIHVATLNSLVSASAVGFISGAGADSDHTIVSNVTAAVRNGVQLTARNVEIVAENRVSKPDLPGQNISGSAKALIGLAGSFSDTLLTLNTVVSVGNADINVVGPTSNNAVLQLHAFNRIDADEQITFTAAGLGAGAKVNTNIRTLADVARVEVADGALLRATGAIVMSARGAGDVDIQANAEANGGVGVVVGTSRVDIRPLNEIVIGNADILAVGDIWLSAGRSGDFVSDTYRVESRIDSYSSAAIPVDEIDAKAWLLQTNLITVGAGALLQTAGEARLHAERLGLNNMSVGAAGHSWAANLFSAGAEFIKGDSLSESHSLVTVNGTVETGIQRRQGLTLTAWDNGSATRPPSIKGYISTDGAAENAIQTARSGNNIGATSFDLVYDGTTYTVDVGAGSFASATALKNHIQSAVNAELGTGKVVVLLDADEKIGFGLPNVTLNDAAAETALNLAKSGNSIAATSFTINYDGTNVLVNVGAFSGSTATALEAHVQQAIDTALINAAVANLGDVHVFTSSGQLRLELGPLARTWHTIGTFEPGFQVGFITVESQLLEELRFAEAQIALYPANTTLVTFYTSEINRINAELAELGLLDTSGGPGREAARERAQLAVTINHINANAGKIDVRGDQLAGIGRFVAPGDAAVNIINDTPATLKLRGISISQETGGLYINGAKVVGEDLQDRRDFIQDENQANVDWDNIFNQFEGNVSLVVPGFLAIPDGSGDAPDVHVENTLIVTIATDSDQYTWNDIIVLGPTEGSGIIAPTADLFLGTPQSGKGDVQIFGSIVAATQTIVAGGTLFVDGVSMFEVDGKPYTAWAGVTTAPYGDGTQSAPWMGTASSLAPFGVEPNLAAHPGVKIAETGLYADRIIINAEYININGVLQSGYDKYELTLGTAAQNEINTLLGQAGTPSRFFLPTTSANSRHFQVFYIQGDTPAKGTIEVADVAVSGGFIDITGHILNSANGKIRALGGYGEIKVVNDTNHDLVVNDLDASKRGAGVVLIKDKAKFKVDPPTPDHLWTDGVQNVTTGEVIRVGTSSYYKYIVEGAEHAPVTNSLNLGAQTYTDKTKWALLNVYVTLYEMTADGLYISTDDGQTSSGRVLQGSYDLGEEVQYQPTDGWRFGWSVGLTQKENYKSVKVSSAWVFIPLGTEFSGPWQDIEVEQQPTLKEESGYYYFAPSDSSDYGYNKVVKTTYDSRWSSGTPGVGTFDGVQVERKYRSTWYGTTYITATYTMSLGKDITHNHSVEADRPIDVQFIGKQEGKITVESTGTGNVLVLGALANPTGLTEVTANGKIESFGEGAFVGGRRVELDAGKGIGTSALQPLNTRVTDPGASGIGGLYAETTTGGIYVREQLGELAVDEVLARSGGDVVVTAQGGITVGRETAFGFYDGRVEGGNITLVAAGAITLPVLPGQEPTELTVSDAAGRYYLERSGAGGVGNSAGRPLVLDSGIAGVVGAKVNVIASGDVFLMEEAGDLRVETINTSGDVYVNVDAGDLLDGNTSATRDTRTYEELKGGVWTDLALTRDLGALGKIDAARVTFRSVKEAEYQTYWNLRSGQADGGAVYDSGHVVHLSAEEVTFYTEYYGPRDLAAVDGASDTITLAERHVYGTGSPVTYHNGGSASLAIQGGGTLIDGAQYYVIVVDDTKIQLAATSDDAANGIAIDLAAVASLPATHSLSTDVAAAITTLENARTVQYHGLHGQYGGYGDTFRSRLRVHADRGGREHPPQQLQDLDRGGAALRGQRRPAHRGVRHARLTIEDPNIVGASVTLVVYGGVGAAEGETFSTRRHELRRPRRRRAR